MRTGSYVSDAVVSNDHPHQRFGFDSDWIVKRTSACGSRLPPTPELIGKGMHYMHMDGRAVFRWAVAILSDTILDVLQASNLRPQDVISRSLPAPQSGATCVPTGSVGTRESHSSS